MKKDYSVMVGNLSILYSLRYITGAVVENSSFNKRHSVSFTRFCLFCVVSASLWMFK